MRDYPVFYLDTKYSKGRQTHLHFVKNIKGMSR